jgi:hypothetical protein
VFSLPFTPFELDCLARNTDEDHALIDTILAQEGREGFAAGWLRACGWEDEACAVEAWSQRSDPEEVAPEVEGRRLYVDLLQSLSAQG